VLLRSETVVQRATVKLTCRSPIDIEKDATMTRTLLAMAAALALGSVAACANTASTGGGAAPSAVDGVDAPGGGQPIPAPTLNDSFHYPSSS
jgi:hypothetical protein